MRSGNEMGKPFLPSGLAGCGGVYSSLCVLEGLQPRVALPSKTFFWPLALATSYLDICKVVSYSFVEIHSLYRITKSGLITGIHYSVLAKLYYTFSIMLKQFSKESNICFPVSFLHPLRTQCRDFQKYVFSCHKGDYYVKRHPVQSALMPLN